MASHVAALPCASVDESGAKGGTPITTIDWTKYLLPSPLGASILLCSAGVGVAFAIGAEKLSILVCFPLALAVAIGALTSVFDFTLRGHGTGDWLAATVHLLALVPSSCLLFLALHAATVAVDLELDLRRAETELPAALAAATIRCAAEGEGTTHSDVDRQVVDCGPPVRIAFPHGVGFLDNWSALVYDPSHAMGSIRLDGGTIQDHPHPLRPLFGGQVVQCDPLRGAFYRCRWT